MAYDLIFIYTDNPKYEILPIPVSGTIKDVILNIIEECENLTRFNEGIVFHLKHEDKPIRVDIIDLKSITSQDEYIGLEISTDDGMKNLIIPYSSISYMELLPENSALFR